MAKRYDQPGQSTRKQAGLRQFFNNEHDNLNPFIANHINDLGLAVGLQFGSATSEEKFGTKTIDVVARLAGTGERFVIESQMTTLDDNHISRAQSYAQDIGATGVIWIAPDFRQDHIDLFNWLNRKTNEATYFYAVEAHPYLDNGHTQILFNRVAGPPANLLQLSKSQRGRAMQPKQYIWQGTNEPQIVGHWRGLYSEILNAAIDGGVDISHLPLPSDMNSTYPIFNPIVINKNGQKFAFQGTGNAEDMQRRIGAILNMMGKQITVVLRCDKEVILPRAQDRHTDSCYRMKIVNIPCLERIEAVDPDSE